MSKTPWYKQTSILQISAIFFFIVASSLILNDRFNWFDDSYYIMLAKALATGQGYYDINLPKPELHKLFPPGLSILLTLPSLFNFELKTSIIIFKVVLIACGALSLYIFKYLAKQEAYLELPITLSIIVAATSIALIGHNARVASEMPYILFSILAFICLNYYENSPNLSKPLFLSAFFVVASILTRSVGILILPAIIISWIIRRKFIKLLLLLSIVIVLMTPWIVLTKKTGAGGTSRYMTDMWVQYTNTDSDTTTSPIKAISNKLFENAKLIVGKDIPRIIFSISASSFILDNYWANLFSFPIRLLIALLTLIPIFSQLWPNPRIPTIYLLFYLGLLLIWPWEPSRFLIPLIPFLLLNFFTILENLTKKIFNYIKQDLNFSSKISYTVAAILIFSNLISDIRFINTIWKSGDYTFEAAKFWQDTQESYKWINQNLSQNVILGCIPALEAYVYLYTERKALALPTNPVLCQQLQVSHIILTDEKLVNNQYSQSIADFQNLIKRTGSDEFLKLVYQNDTVKIFEVDLVKLNMLLDASTKKRR